MNRAPVCMCARTLTSLGIALAVSTGDSAAQSDSIGTTTARAIDRYVTAKMRSSHIPGLAIAIVNGERAIYLKGYGRADESGRAVTAQTPFMIGSVTKSLTALAVFQLVDAGKVQLDAPVTRYIPWFSTSRSSVDHSNRLRYAV
jgi:CubicO group peptidase (beta-lactamase class C family)